MVIACLGAPPLVLYAVTPRGVQPLYVLPNEVQSLGGRSLGVGVLAVRRPIFSSLAPPGLGPGRSTLAASAGHIAFYFVATLS